MKDRHETRQSPYWRVSVFNVTQLNNIVFTIQEKRAVAKYLAMARKCVGEQVAECENENERNPSGSNRMNITQGRTILDYLRWQQGWFHAH